jgi:hypothetical protein
LLLNTPDFKNPGPKAAKNSKQQTLQFAIHPNSNQNQNKSAVRQTRKTAVTTLHIPINQSYTLLDL